MNSRLEVRLLAEHIHHATPGGIQPRRPRRALLLTVGVAVGFVVGLLVLWP